MSRSYLLGLPVIITVTEEGQVSYSVDLAEASRLRDLFDSQEGVDDPYTDEQVTADAQVIETALQRHISEERPIG